MCKKQQPHSRGRSSAVTPEVWSGSRSGLCPQAVTSGAPGAIRPQPPALAKVLKRPRCGHGLRERQGGQGSPAERAEISHLNLCDSWDSPVPLPAATRARRTLSQVKKMSLLWSRGNLYLTTQLGVRKQGEIPRSRGYILGNHKWHFTGTSSAGLLCSGCEAAG